MGWRGIGAACVLLVLLFQLAAGQNTLNCETQTFTVSASGSVSVDISFALAVAGFPSFGPSLGQVSFYGWDESNESWQITGTFSGEAAGDQFGASVAVVSDTNTAFIGAPGALDGTGVAYEFALNNSTGKWAPTGFVLQGEAAGDAFGAAVSLSRGAAVFGAPNADSSAGKVYIYERPQANDTWSLNSQFSGSAAGASFGYAVNVAHSGSNVAVGAPSVSGSLAGSAYIFCKATANGTFTMCMDTASRSSAPGDLYGYSVGAISDSVNWDESGLFVGSPGEELVYFWNTWYYDYTYNETIASPSGGAWGTSVAIDTTYYGGYVLPIVGSPQGASASATSPSYATALLFEYGYWGDTFEPSLSLPNGSPSFGSAVALSRGTALIASDNSVTFWCTGVDYHY